MELLFNKALSSNYKSNSQIARILTEDWVSKNSYCLNCGNTELKPYQKNNPAADFYCTDCKADYELKSFLNLPKTKIVDGAYDTMINKILLNKNPNFLFLQYSLEYKVINFFSIPKFYFTPDMIEKRKPLSTNARRANWIGCNIRYDHLPKSGIIHIVKDKLIIDQQVVLNNWQRTSFLRNQKVSSRGWSIEILGLVEKMTSEIFSINDLYEFEGYLKSKFPNNKFIKEKIRQQLQVLRDKGLVDFLGNGLYKKVK